MLAVRALDLDRGRILRPLVAALIGMLVGTMLVGPLPAVLSQITNSRTVGGNTMAAAARFDVVPPSISGSVIAKASGTGLYLAGFIKSKGTFYIYANVADTGAGASGVASVTANVSSITTGATAVALVAGAYSVGGVSYTYRSASQTATASAAQGYAYSITATDNAGNTATNSSFTVVMDTTAPAGSDIQTTNAGTAGQPGAGDTIVYTYTEPIDPESILAGWTDASTGITVRFATSGYAVTIWNAANTAQLPLGSINLGAAYVTANTTFSATMVRSGATITVTLGTLTSGTVKTNTTAKNMVWTPGATATDAAGNACSTSNKTEINPPVDIDF